jgi:hypothetical protein
MSKNTQKKSVPVVASKPVRDWKSAPFRTQIYIMQLTRKYGATAQELKDAVLDQLDVARNGEAFTSHNSYSLAKLAATYGFRFWSDAETFTGAKRYYFASAMNDPRIAAQEAKARDKARMEREAAKAAKIAAKAPVAPVVSLAAMQGNSTVESAMKAQA